MDTPTHGRSSQNSLGNWGVHIAKTRKEGARTEVCGSSLSLSASRLSNIDRGGQPHYRRAAPRSAASALASPSARVRGSERLPGLRSHIVVVVIDLDRRTSPEGVFRRRKGKVIATYSTEELPSISDVAKTH